MEEQDNALSKLEWSFYFIFLPLSFTVVLTGLVFTMMDYDLKESAITVGKNIPLVASLISDSSKESLEIEENKEEQLMVQLEQKQSEVAKLEDQLAQNDRVINELNGQIQELKEKVLQLNKQLEDKHLSEEEREKRLSEMADLYEKMSSKKAAAILEKLALNEAAPILQQINDNRQAAILAKMEPSTAAKLTLALKELY